MQDIVYIGCYDKTLDLFESQYAVPQGMAYNSYVILADKVAVLDTVDARKTDEWLDNLTRALGGRGVDYLIVQHMEPDHSAGIALLAEKYPEMRLVASPAAFPMLAQFTGQDFGARKMPVKEGDKLDLGGHELSFIMAPMVHWPEVMVTYDAAAKTLFSADAFGRFGDTDPAASWLDEARRYYINIVGKYGAPVQTLLKKAAALDIAQICPLHGPVLAGDALRLALEKYAVWSSYQPEEAGVLVAHASIHGNTAKAARQMAAKLRELGVSVEVCDLTRDDWAEAVAGAFRYSGLLLAASSYNADVFPPMAHFLARLKALGYRGRAVGLVENGTWAPSALKAMRRQLEDMPGLQILDPQVTIRSCPTAAVAAQLDELCAALAAACLER